MDELLVRLASSKDRNSLETFNKQIYPTKKRISECMEFWRSQSLCAENGNIVLVDNHEKIHGQMLVSEMNYYYNGAKIKSVWLYDLIVEKKLRRTAWGVDMIVFGMDNYPNSCSTGSGPQALPLHLKLGNKKLGEIKKYVRIGNPFYFATSFHRGGLKSDEFPSCVIVEDCKFHKIRECDLPNILNPYNDNLLEIGRDKDFLKWRFFNQFHDYAFYKADKSDVFFVVRAIVKKGITALVLVDYRYDTKQANDFRLIVAASIKIANNIRLPIIICGSSLKISDAILESNRFKSVGRPRPVIGFVKCKDRKSDIDERNFCFVTLADSDGETNW